MVTVGSRQKGAVGVASVTYSSQVLPASRISAKRQLAMLKDSHGTMVTAVAIVLRRQGFMAEEHDGNILISCGGRLYAALHFLRLDLQGRQVVALQPSVDVTYFLPAPVIEDAWEQQGDTWVRSSASAVFGDDTASIGQTHRCSGYQQRIAPLADSFELAVPVAQLPTVEVGPCPERSEAIRQRIVKAQAITRQRAALEWALGRGDD